MGGMARDCQAACFLSKKIGAIFFSINNKNRPIARAVFICANGSDLVGEACPDGGDESVEEGGLPVRLRFRETTEDIVVGRHTGTFDVDWSADAETKTEEVLSAEHIDDILDAIVSSSPR